MLNYGPVTVILFIIVSILILPMLVFAIIVNTMVFEISNFTYFVVAALGINGQIKEDFEKLSPFIIWCQDRIIKWIYNYE